MFSYKYTFIYLDLSFDTSVNQTIAPLDKIDAMLSSWV